jgi:hypothetical protein
MSGVDTSIQLPPDSTGKKLRMFDPGTGELQEVVVLADQDGNPVDVRAQRGMFAVAVMDVNTRSLLEDISQKLSDIRDLLIADTNGKGLGGRT